jgi:hypothetical protein
MSTSFSEKKIIIEKIRGYKRKSFRPLVDMSL